MHPRLDRLSPPGPDYRRFIRVLRRRPVDRVPLIELGIHPEVIATLLDEAPASGSDDDRRNAVEQSVRAHYRLGFDVVKTSARIPWHTPRLYTDGSSRGWADEHEGPIHTTADIDSYPWPQPGDIDFSAVDVAAGVLPSGMALIGFSGGVLEFTMDLMGMERFMLATAVDPGLIEAVVERVGRTLHRVFEEYCQREEIKALWLGDDLGHKTGLLVSPKLLERYVIPWYRRFADLAHQHGRPFMLHSCGDTGAIMETLVEDVGIDAKHSFEDVIEPVEQFVDRWGDRIAVLGGVDVHLLSTGTESAIRSRTLEILRHAVPRCSYAAGSGNSIPDYVPPDHFLAMVEAVHEFNFDRSG